MLMIIGACVVSVPDMEGYRLRAARAEDVDAVLRLWQTSAENAQRPADAATSVERLLHHDPEALLLAETDAGELIGSVIGGWNGWRFYLYRLAVREGWRRRGVARALVAAAESRARSLGAGRTDAVVLADNATGAKAWEDFGYRAATQWVLWQNHLTD